MENRPKSSTRCRSNDGAFERARSDHAVIPERRLPLCPGSRRVGVNAHGSGSRGLRLLRWRRSVAEHFPECAHQHGLCRLALRECQEVVDAEALCLARCLAVRVWACMDPGVFDVKSWSIGVEDQVPPIASILRGAISG